MKVRRMDYTITVAPLGSSTGIHPWGRTKLSSGFAALAGAAALQTEPGREFIAGVRESAVATGSGSTGLCRQRSSGFRANLRMLSPYAASAGGSA